MTVQGMRKLLLELSYGMLFVACEKHISAAILYRLVSAYFFFHYIIWPGLRLDW